MAREEVKRRNLTMQGLAGVVSAIVAVLGLAAADPRTQLFYVGVGIPLLLTALVGIGRLARAKEPTAVAVAAIQHNWIVLSVSLAFLSLVPASFFDTAMALRAAAGGLAGILVILSAVLLLDTRKRSGVDLSI